MSYVSFDELVKSLQTDDTVKSSRCKARGLTSSHFNGAILRNEAYLSYAAVTKDEAQRSRWTFYKVVSLNATQKTDKRTSKIYKVCLLDDLPPKEAI